MANYEVTSGKTSTGLILKDGDTMTVAYRERGMNTLIEAGGEMNVSNAGEIYSSFVSSGGSIFIFNFLLFLLVFWFAMQYIPFRYRWTGMKL